MGVPSADIPTCRDLWPDLSADPQRLRIRAFGPAGWSGRPRVTADPRPELVLRSGGPTGPGRRPDRPPGALSFRVLSTRWPPRGFWGAQGPDEAGG